MTPFFQENGTTPLGFRLELQQWHRLPDYLPECTRPTSWLNEGNPTRSKWVVDELCPGDFCGVDKCCRYLPGGCVYLTTTPSLGLQNFDYMGGSSETSYLKTFSKANLKSDPTLTFLRCIYRKEAPSMGLQSFDSMGRSGETPSSTLFQRRISGIVS